MATIPVTHHERAWRSGRDAHGARQEGRRARGFGGGLRGAARLAGAVLAGLFAADRVLPEADPGEVRALLIELGRLDAAALPGERVAALRSFQLCAGLPPDGTADGRTVSRLMRAVREHRELRAMGL
ncbi:hypothetical protein HDA32_003917 [Spinactinospora alkalitolerans]|uniref:Peptidoglycan binding-like domain-containing protein n=1 Tax=Spinactinospora alkalitolerans TaxID=687207 RepID=A0A852TZS0_9ACTN|nr:hypothetical protein [Spinactinospora alkalitolerans]NYE48797.1 hypothetical protein [Spinactinospora alkalitolerans]